MANIYINQFEGINNITKPTKLKAGELVDAINVDITTQGTIKSRPTWKKVKDLNSPHSLFSNINNMFGIEEDNLIKFDKSLKKEVIDEGYLGLHTSFVKYNNQTVICNNNVIKRYKNNKLYNLTPEKYINNFDVNISENGAFPKGMYKVAITYVHDDGMEGSTSNPVVVNLEDGEKITLNNLNQTQDININKIRVYISKTNSSELYRYGDFDITTNSIDIYYNQMSYGQRIDKVNLDTLSNGDFITTFNGYLITAKENKIYISLPGSFLMDYDVYSGYLEFDGNITMLETIEGATGGIYVSDEYNCYYLSGDISSLQRERLDCSPAIKYTSCKSPITNEFFFYTNRGQISAGKGGNIKNLTDEKFLPDGEFSKGASMVVLHDGRRKIINSLQKNGNSLAGVSDWCKIVD